jgi:hypothetical protein
MSASPHLKAETEPVFETLFEFRTKDKVQKHSHSERDTEPLKYRQNSVDSTRPS